MLGGPPSPSSMSKVSNTVCHQEQVLLLTAGCEVVGVAFVSAGSAAGGGLWNVPGPVAGWHPQLNNEQSIVLSQVKSVVTTNSKK